MPGPLPPSPGSGQPIGQPINSLPCTGKCLKHLLIKLMIPSKVKQQRLSRNNGKYYAKLSKIDPEYIYNTIKNL